MSNSNNRVIVPAARAALDQFKMEAANEVGVNLKQGYNGDLTSKQAGSIGGQMVKKMIEAYENGMKQASSFHRTRGPLWGKRKEGGRYLEYLPPSLHFAAPLKHSNWHDFTGQRSFPCLSWGHVI